MAAHHSKAHSSAPRVSSAPYVEVMFAFVDPLKKSIHGLEVQLKAGMSTPDAPAWKYDSGQLKETPPETPAATSDAASAPHAASATDASEPKVSYQKLVQLATTDQNGCAGTIQNAANGQPIDVLVKDHSGEYVWKASVTPTKNISLFTLVSPSFYVDAKTKKPLPGKEEFEHDPPVKLPVVAPGQLMTIERLVSEYGKYIGWSQKVTEQGEIRREKDTKVADGKEDVKDKQGKPVIDSHTHKPKQKKKFKTVPHYHLAPSGSPRTIVLNVLGSRLNYPNPENFTDAQYAHMASSLGITDVALIKALVLTETQGHPYEENGLPTHRLIHNSSHEPERGLQAGRARCLLSSFG